MAGASPAMTPNGWFNVAGTCPAQRFFAVDARATANCNADFG